MRYMFDGGGNGENRLEGGIYDGWWPSAPITPASLNIVRPPTSLSLSPNNICRRQKHVRLEENRFFFLFIWIFWAFSHGGTHLHIVKLKEHTYTHTQKKEISLCLSSENRKNRKLILFNFCGCALLSQLQQSETAQGPFQWQFNFLHFFFEVIRQDFHHTNDNLQISLKINSKGVSLDFTFFFWRAQSTSPGRKRFRGRNTKESTWKFFFDTRASHPHHFLLR